MTGEHEDEEVIFKAALKLESAAERTAFLKSACRGDAELLSRVEALLKVHFEDKSFLKSPAGTDVTFDYSPLTEKPGTIIGRYKLLQQIGEGGFGVVYMAEQEKPIRRRVALKIIKLGMDTKQVIARFEAERQALAMMDHPNIARVLDAGATDTGRPYFVMELVKGIPITEYCDKNNLDTRQRLDLFINVCKAVQHAHQKGIIHRDIKPTNVMITLHDGIPVPKVIDFGIAKATQQRLTEKTLFTEFRQFIGTPEYMSPEQAEMSGLDVDTRTDIYALGVLLYELLTGTTPFGDKELRSAAYDEIRRIIREDEPPKPSTKLSTLGEALTDVAKHRNSGPNQLRRMIRGELDWIVLKTLEKDRTRRYETANGLVRDVQRYLADEPVVAGPPSTVYRVRKFVRRNKAAVMTTAAIAAVIVIGFVVSTIMYFQAEQARKKESAARVVAVESKQQAEQAEEAEKKQRHRAEQFLAEAQLDRGIRLLNEGNGLGLLDLLEARITADQIPDIRESAGRLWAIAHDLWSGRLVHVMRSAEEQDLAFSPDGKLLAIPSNMTVQLWDGLGKRISAVEFSPDGRLLAAHSVEGVSRLWDVATGEPVGPVLEHDVGTGESSKEYWELNRAWWSAAFSPDSNLLATASLDGTVQLWETDTGQPYRKPFRYEMEVWAVAFSPDGRLLASMSKDQTVQLWEVASGEPYGPLLRQAGSGGYNDQVLFSPDGKLLATSGAGDLWETESGQKKTNRLQHGKKWVEDLVFSPDGKLLATTSTEWMVRLWETDTGQQYGQPLNHEAQVGVVAFGPEGRLLATGSHDQTVRLWDFASGQPYSRPLRHQGYLLHRVIFSPDGRFLASSVAVRGTTRIWRAYQPLRTEVVAQRSGIGADAISPDGKVGAMISDNTVHLWDTETFKALGEPLRHDSQVSTIALSPDGKLLATVSGIYPKTTIMLWDVDTGDLIGTLLKTMANQALAFSPDCKLLAGGAGFSGAVLFETGTQERLYTLNCGGQVHGLAFSPDGKVLATGPEKGTVQLRDVATGEQLGPALVHGEPVLAVVYSPDGKLLATASGEDCQNVRIWDVGGGPPYHSLALPAGAISGTEALESFSKDGTLLVKRLADGIARVWRVPTAAADVREMQLKTWVALGAERNEKGEVRAIPWELWRTLREELYFFPRARMPKLDGGVNGLGKGGFKLTWTTRSGATSYNVYFGTESKKLTLLDKVKEPVYEDLPTLEKDNTYWCRVDTVKPDGAIVKGSLWRLSSAKLVGWWKFDEGSGIVAADSSGFGYDGKLNGMDDRDWVDGITGKALEFDGNDDHVSIPALDLYSNNVTISARIKRNGRQETITTGIVCSSEGSTDAGFGFGYGPGWSINHHLAYFWNNDPKTWGWDSKLFVPDNEWVFVALVVEPQKATIYMNDGSGMKSSINKVHHYIEEFNGITSIGWDPFEPRFFKGLIDDVRIYNYALSENEIAAICAGEALAPMEAPKWVVDVVKEEYPPLELEGEKDDEYYVPIGLEPEREEEGELMLVEELKIERGVLGEGSPATLINLARLYDKQRRYEESEPLFVEALEIRQRVLGQENQDTLNSMRDLGWQYHRQRQYDKAEPLFEKVLEIRQKLLGEENRDTLNSMRELAVVYRDQDRYEEAESLFVKTLETQQRILGEEHTETLWTMRDLAVVYRDQDRNEEAESLFVKTLEIQSRVLGEEHTETLWTMGVLASQHHRQKQYDKAEALFKKILEIRRRVLGEEHWDTLRTMRALAVVYRDQGRYEEAESLFVKTLEIQSRVLGEEHPDTLASMHGLAVEYRDQNRYEEAESMFVKTLEIQRRVLGEEHPDTAGPLNSLAWFWATCPEDEVRDGAKAVEYATKACELTSWENASYVDTLAAACAEAGDFESAVKWQEKAIELLTEKNPPEWQTEWEERVKLYQSGKPYRESP
jgi:WD40 repeat protein/tetratricopeptide (TPR) repeat protein